MSAPTTTVLLQALSITSSLLASGGILTLSLFDIPELQSQPASRSLPSIRWLFSRGSHYFPQAAIASSAGFAYLAFISLKPSQTFTQILKLASNGETVNGYLVAAALSLSIHLFTQLAMVPTNFELMRLNGEMGGKRSGGSIREGRGKAKSAEESISGVGEGGEFRD